MVTAGTERHEIFVAGIVRFAEDVMRGERRLRRHTQLTDPFRQANRRASLPPEIAPIGTRSRGALSRARLLFFRERIKRLATIGTRFRRQIGLAARVILPKASVHLLNAANEGLQVQRMLPAKRSQRASIRF